MKKLIFIAIILAGIQYWDEIKASLLPTPDYATTQSEQVVLYSTSWCPYCKKTRELLQQYNIDYVEHDIEKSEHAHQQYRALGGNGVPVTRIGNIVIHGYRPEAILDAVAQE